MHEGSEAASSLPSSREFITLILGQLSRIGEEGEEAGATRTAENPSQEAFDDRDNESEIEAFRCLSMRALAEVRNLLFTLHSIFPSELLLALDILDRKMIKEITVICDDDRKEPQASRHEAVQGRPIYIISSLRSANRRATSQDDDHIVCLDAWNCSCPTFTAAAAGDAFLEGFGNEDGTAYSNAEGQESEKVDWPTDQFQQYEFGGLLPKSFSLAQTPVCKHLVACILGNQCPALFGGNIEHLRMSRASAAAEWANMI